MWSWIVLVGVGARHYIKMAGEGVNESFLFGSATVADGRAVRVMWQLVPPPGSQVLWPVQPLRLLWVTHGPEGTTTEVLWSLTPPPAQEQSRSRSQRRRLARAHKEGEGAGHCPTCGNLEERSRVHTACGAH